MSEGRPMSQTLIVAEQLLELARGNETIHPIALNLYNLVAFQQRKIIDLTRSIEKPERNDNTAWLVEIMWGNDPVYFQLAYDDDWTKDHDQALHFCRKIDAERCIEHYGWTIAKPVEHMWCDGSALPSTNRCEGK